MGSIGVPLRAPLRDQYFELLILSFLVNTLKEVGHSGSRQGFTAEALGYSFTPKALPFNPSTLYKEIIIRNPNLSPT